MSYLPESRPTFQHRLRFVDAWPRSTRCSRFECWPVGARLPTETTNASGGDRRIWKGVLRPSGV